MPNWCENEVHIDANEKTFEQIKCLMFNEKGELDFEQIMPVPAILDKIQIHTDKVMIRESNDAPPRHPTPEDLQALDAAGATSRYDWCVENWGTKWNPSDAHVDINEEMCSIYLRFDTAWAPPEGIAHHLMKCFPNADIDWFFKEPLMRFAGWVERP